MRKGSDWMKYLSGMELVQAASVSSLSFRESSLKRRLYRRAYHAKNKEEENGKNKDRYHKKYKSCPEFKSASRLRWRHFASKQSRDWQVLRSRKYRKHYSLLSERRKHAIREAYKRWANENWDKRVQYAREWRAKQPTAGLRRAIAEAARTGDIAKLAAVCERAISRADETGRSKRN